MPKPIFDDDEPFLDYGAIDELSAMGIGDRGYANVNPPRGGDELFGDPFERRAREIDRTPNNLRPVQIVPQQSGPWSRSNQFGTEQPFAPDANNRQTILKLPEWGFPQVWSVMLSINPPSNAAANYLILANVEAGVGGTTDTFQLDWSTGTAFSVVANALNISAFYRVSSVIPNDLRLRVLVGRETLTRSAPKRSFTGLLPPLGGTLQVSIEKYAKSLTLLPVSFTSNPYVATFLLQFRATDTSAVLGEITGAQILALGNGATVDVPGGANVLTIVNNGLGPGATSFQLIHNLGL